MWGGECFKRGRKCDKSVCLQPDMSLSIRHQRDLALPPTVQKHGEKREQKHRSAAFQDHPVMFGKQFLVCQEVQGPPQC